MHVCVCIIKNLNITHSLYADDEEVRGNSKHCPVLIPHREKGSTHTLYLDYLNVYAGLYFGPSR